MDFILYVFGVMVQLGSNINIFRLNLQKIYKLIWMEGGKMPMEIYLLLEDLMITIISHVYSLIQLDRTQPDINGTTMSKLPYPSKMIKHMMHL